MKFHQFTVVFQEVPDEISLLFEITNCPNTCEGCHSPHLRENIGTELSLDKFKQIVSRYFGLITNVVFFGGDQYESEIVPMLDYIKALGIKSTLWTGCETVSKPIESRLDYLKTGGFDPRYGGLTTVGTNQRYVRVATGESINIRG